jgi:hypothetical protein
MAGGAPQHRQYGKTQCGSPSQGTAQAGEGGVRAVKPTSGRGGGVYTSHEVYDVGNGLGNQDCRRGLCGFCHDAERRRLSTYERHATLCGKSSDHIAQ